MDNNDVQLVGGPCGQHGPYTFYKAFKYVKSGVKKIITLSEFFFVKMWRDSDLLCIGELQLLWIDKNSEQTLASLRLYFLPENTPEGRIDQGEDEVLAISEKVVIRVEDLITWITVEAEWTWGRLAKCEEDLKDITVESDQLACPRKPAGNSFNLSETTLDFSDVEQEREKLELSEGSTWPHVIILSFPKYCRYRAMMKRLEGVENVYLKYKIVNALGGFYVLHPNTRVLFCRDTFDYPELEGHELLCNHLAPKLKGRPRGKRKKRSVSPGSDSNESESSLTNHYTRSVEYKSNESRSDSPMVTRRSTRCHENNENKQFVKVLSAFMKSKRIPMGRIPSLGYKELNLHEFFTKVHKLGGYECVTTNRLWKSIFDDMTGHLNSTSAATIIRRHYERFLLPYERHLKGEEDKPLPVTERRRLKSKRGSLPFNSRTSDSDSSNESPPSTSRSSSTPPASNYNKESSPPGKTSSLRSIRVKPERQKDRQSSVSDKVGANNQNNVEQTVKTEPEDIKTAVDTSVVKSESTEVKVNVKVEVTVETKVEITVDNEATDTIKEEVTEEVKTEIKEENTSPKSEPDEIKPSTPEGSKTEGSIPDKNAEPVTTAVAPVVVTSIPDKMLSPVEGKENIPEIKTGDTATVNATPEVVNVPFKAKTPEVVQIDSDAYKKLGDSFIHDVKRIKLDILKEGGLEVTPVKPGLGSPLIKEIRPSVIQPPSHNDISKNIMPPPLASNVLPKRNNASSLSPTMNITQIKASPSTPVKEVKPDSFQFINGATPPKVVQSKSIYSYSERTIYGNPKDILQPVMAPQAPKFIGSAARHGGSNPMDLSITSPQKPVIEIMRIPQSFTSTAQTPYNRESVTKNLYKTSPPVLDGRRLGSNLEITLVGPKTSGNPSYVPKQPSAHKRSSTETYAQKIAKLKAEEHSSKSSKYNIPHTHKSKMEFPVPSPFAKSSMSSSVSKTDVRHTSPAQKPLVPTLPQSLPPYLARFAGHDNTNGMNPYLPLMDSLYYQAALQNVYSNISNLSNMPPPMLPLPTPEQLKFYAELMAHGRLNFPFSLPNDGHSSMNNNKKP